MARFSSSSFDDEHNDTRIFNCAKTTARKLRIVGTRARECDREKHRFTCSLPITARSSAITRAILRGVEKKLRLRFPFDRNRTHQRQKRLELGKQKIRKLNAEFS